MLLFREIIRWDEEAPNDYSKNLQKTARRYKDPSVALEYAVEKRENSTELFHPDRLDASNYVKEMHKFLYREEEAQTKLLDRLKNFKILNQLDVSKLKVISYGFTAEILQRKKVVYLLLKIVTVNKCTHSRFD